MADEDGGEVQRRRAQNRAEQMRELDKERRSRIVKIGVALLLAIIFILFIIRNSNPVSESEGVDFVFVTADAPLIWVYLVCALLGGLVGYLLGRPSKAQRRVIREAEGDEPRAGRGPEPRRPDDGER